MHKANDKIKDGDSENEGDKKPKEKEEIQKPGGNFGKPGMSVDDANEYYTIRIKVKL